MNREIIELRQVVQKLVPMLAGKGLRVTQIGARAYVEADPKTSKPFRVNIPSIPDNAEPDFIRAIQGFIDHEIGHVLITDWSCYGGVNLTENDLRNPKVRRFIGLHNIIEDTMIEPAMERMFPGSRRNISDLRKHFINKVSKPAIDSASDENERFSYLLVVLMRALAGHQEFCDFMDADGHWENPMVKEVIARFDKKTLERLPGLTTTRETYEVAKELEAILYPEKDKEDDQDDQSEDQDGGSSDGQSQDKPDKKAGEGDGDGERDHSESEPGDESESEQSSGEGKSKKEDSEDDNGDGQGKSSDGENDDEAEAKSGNGGKSEKESNDEGDDENEASGADGEDEVDDEDEADGEDGLGQTDGDDADSEDDGDDADGDDADGDADSEDDGDDADGDDDADGGEGDGDDADDADKEPGQGEGSAGEEVVDTGDYDSGAGKSDEDGSVGGVGSGGGSSMFDFDDDEFEDADMSKQISIIIEKEMVEAIDASDYSIFTREYDRIETFVPPANLKPKWIPDMEDLTRSMTGKMQKDIERMLAAQRLSRNTPGFRRGRLHPSNLHRLAAGDDRVFTRREDQVMKDTAVTLLVDNSGSMGGYQRGHQRNGFNKMKTAMIAAFALAQTLERVKMANEIIGFTTGEFPSSEEESVYEDIRNHLHKGINFSRTWPIMMPIYKSFDERITSEVKSRIAFQANAQVGMNGNIDGESLEYAAMRIMRRRERRKVIIVLSDGHPAGASNADGHLKMMTQKIQDAGIDLIGIGIMDSAVKRFYDKAVVLQKIEDLPVQLMQELKEILK